MRPQFTPELFIGIGETGAYYTLRETYLHERYIPGEGPMGNAMVNGVYQGSVEYEIRSFHHFNLSQDVHEAFAKAQDFASKSGMRLATPDAESVEEEMRQILRETEEMKQLRLKAEAARAEAREQERLAKMAEQFDKISRHIMPNGPYRDMPFSEVPISYLTWCLTFEGKEPGSLMDVLAYTLRQCKDVRFLPEPNPSIAAGNIGERIDAWVTVIRVISFERDNYMGFPETCWITTMVEKEKGACIVHFGRHIAEVGDVMRIRGTVKKQSEYRECLQTTVNRVKIME